MQGITVKMLKILLMWPGKLVYALGCSAGRGVRSIG